MFFIAHVFHLSLNQPAAAGTWVPLTHTAPGSIGVMLLLPDGTVIAQNSGTSVAWYRLTPDIHGSYINGTWQTLTSMHDTRLYGSTDVLRDGRLFIAGGEYGIGKKTAEVYDPLCNTWLMAPVSGQSFSDSVSKVIANGNVMICPVGPSPSGHVIFFNIVSNNWIAGPKLYRGSYQDEASWVQLPDQSILTIDPFGTNSERYIPASNTWINDANVPVQIYGNNGGEMGAAFLLPDGRAFYLGASGHTAFYTPSGSTSPGSWAAGPDIPNSQSTPDAAAAMMVTGNILCAVSALPTSANHFPSPTSFYEFDYTANTFTQVNAPTGTTESNPSYYTTMLDLPDGTVLFAHFASQTYVYQPTGSPIAAGKPAITSITQNADSTFLLTGTGLNGISGGAAYGDDFQMDTDYPIVRLTDSSNDVYYARTMNWSSTAVMTGATPLSTDFVLPTNLPAGTFSLVVVANGISSDPVAFTNLPIIVTLPASATEGSAPVTGTVILPSAPATDQTVTLTSSLPSRATVTPTITVPAGQTSATFSVTIIDDSILNGSQAAMISASATNYQGGLTYIVVQDNESAILALTSTTALSFSGLYGGPFTAATSSYTLTNKGNYPLGWTAAKSQSWLTLSPTSGVLQPGVATNVTASINTNANILATGSYSDTIIFDNITNGNGDASRTVNLTVTGSPTLAVSSPAINISGYVGGTFAPANAVMTVSNIGTAPLDWTVSENQSWLTFSISGGTLAPGATTNLTLALVASAVQALPVGTYIDSLSFTNTDNATGNTTRIAILSVNAIPAPTLTLAYASNGIVLSWPTGGTGFSYSNYVLQSTLTLTPGSWNLVSPAPSIVGGRYTVTNSISGTQMYYRLSR